MLSSVLGEVFVSLILGIDMQGEQHGSSEASSGITLQEEHTAPHQNVPHTVTV